MRIAYVTDQVLPRTATDTRQMVSMAAALGQAGADVTLVTPARWTSEATTAEEVAAYYQVPRQFDLATVRSVYPNIRGIEKLAQGVVGPRHPAARRADLVYTRHASHPAWCAHGPAAGRLRDVPPLAGPATAKPFAVPMDRTSAAFHRRGAALSSSRKQLCRGRCAPGKASARPQRLRSVRAATGAVAGRGAAAM